ncbi:glycine-rich domain-containing protein [Sphingomonas sp. RT2P30]|uniref:glycine-rich domain-containing protein n=1 Tax=Parasphingomonas halimpatiens TaxID=3096162 RepID=UPI003FA6EC86
MKLGLAAHEPANFGHSKSYLVKLAVERVASRDFSNIKRKINLDQGFVCPDCNIETEYVERRYRQFLALQCAYPEIKIVPTTLIDSFWHAHILDTRAYQKDCDYIFGEFLHHYPYFGLNGEDDRLNLEKSFETTCGIWLAHFDSRPDHDQGPSGSTSCSKCSSCSSCTK